MLGANMASQSPSRHSWENRDRQTMNTVGYFIYVPPPPPLSCTSDSQCTDGYNLSVECRDGYCECRQPLCWIYTYHKNGIFAEISYTCGTCVSLHRSHSRNNMVKTPAYTSQQRIYQNFHQRHDSETASDEDYINNEKV
ncbi:hypothetical protein Avbf_04171 [Armadillidium vulgare]|nr:hypothetical protein Avbf_04171 [Armadillidium vulgare]